MVLDCGWIRQRLDGIRPAASAPRAARTPDGRRAAVLVPLVARGGTFHVVLTRRAAHLRAHAGQIGFPGGRVDEGDASVAATALREAEEEIGLPPSAVELLGSLPEYATGTGFLVTPLIGRVLRPVAWRRQPAEVAAVFEVPLAFLLDPANHRPHRLIHQGRPIDLVSMTYGEHFIWGATAAMVAELSRRLWPAGGMAQYV